MLELSDCMDYEPYLFPKLWRPSQGKDSSCLAGPSQFQRSDKRYIKSSRSCLTLLSISYPGIAFALLLYFGISTLVQQDWDYVTAYWKTYAMFFLVLCTMITISLLNYRDIRRSTDQVMKLIENSGLYLLVLENQLDVEALSRATAEPFRMLFIASSDKEIIQKFVHCGRYLDFYLKKPNRYFKPEWGWMAIGLISGIVEIIFILEGTATDYFTLLPFASFWVLFGSLGQYLDRRAQYLHRVLTS